MTFADDKPQTVSNEHFVAVWLKYQMWNNSFMTQHKLQHAMSKALFLVQTKAAVTKMSVC